MSEHFDTAASGPTPNVSALAATPTPPQFLVDNAGNRLAVVLTPATYEALYAAFEELSDLAASERVLAAVAQGEDEVMPFVTSP